jgi:hypothetical protein
MVNLTDESRSDESDVYSPPASTVLNSSSGSDGDDVASANDIDELEEFEPQVISDTVDDDGDGENRMVADIESNPNSQPSAGASVTQVRKKSKKKVRRQVGHRACKKDILIGLTRVEG